MEHEEFFCKYCGAPLDLEKAVGGVVRCVYCNNAQTLPKTDVSPAALSFLRMGEHDLDTCKFDDAYAAYAKAAELDKEEPEAYFGMALATFKVQFLKDEVNERLQPICHEISDGSILDDKNFRRALELATDEQKREYRKRGREIDEIKEEFYDLQRKGLDYDCFLCVKVTGEDGRTRTADYDRANDIYYYLKDEGYKPFFSEREMKGRTGSDYEALILYALYTSECMLIVCSDESYLQTKWVKNEYTRFLHMLANEEKERDAISFAFHGTSVEKLPSGKKVQGIDLAKPDAYSRIGNFVKVHTPEARKKREEAKAKKQQEEEARNKELEEMRAMLDELKRSRNSAPQTAQSDQVPQKISPASEEEERRRREEEARNKELAELREKLAEMERERTKAAAPAGNLSPAQLLLMMRQAEEEEKSRKKAITEFVVVLSRIRDKAKKAQKEAEGRKRHEEEEAKRKEHEEELRRRREEEEAKRKEHEEELRRRREEMARLAAARDAERRAKEEAERKKRVEAERKRWEEEARKEAERRAHEEACRAEFAKFGGIEGGVLKNYFGKGGKVIIPEGVTKISYNAFDRCDRVTSVTIPKGVTYIGEQAFIDCKELESVVLPDGLTKIGGGAFSGCSKLGSVVLPDSVTETGGRVFANCSGLTSVILSNGLRSIGEDMFLGCDKLTRINIPNSVTEIREGAFQACSGLSRINNSINLTSIGRLAFARCSALKDVVIPDNVNQIGASAFINCTALAHLTLPGGLKTIGLSAFENCWYLKKIDIPAGTIEIGESAFSGCSSLWNVTIPNSVTRIGKFAFFRCSELNEIVIPNSVVEIGTNAFMHCNNLKSVTIPKRFKGGIMNTGLKNIFHDNYKRIQFTFTD